MTDDDRDRLARLETVEGRSVWRRRLGIAALVLIVLAVTAGFAVLLSFSAENNRILEESEAERAESDRAAVDVAQERQDQARSISELCESGEVDQDTERGRRVCEEARESATKDPAEQVQVAKGETGATGERGAQGPQGIPGQKGETGEPGPEGEPGEDGEPGATGAQGPQGDQGIRGVPGEKGDVGETGADGSQGPVGPTGADGASGSRGEPGAPGSRGETGATGQQGPQGATGERGPEGERGPAGEKGEKGEKGADGADGEDGADGRGVASMVCGDDGRWDVTYTDGEVEDGGVCREVQAEDPEPEPTDPPEATEPPPSALGLLREQETVEVWPPSAAA